MTGGRRLRGGQARPGFTMMETSIALGILLVAMMLVAQVAAWSLGERERNATRRDALDVAANVLEEARALPWRELTPQWASARRLPEDLGGRLEAGSLKVRVEAEPSRPLTKRVTVEVGWKTGGGVQVVPVRLVGLFSDRSADTAGGKP